MIGNNCLLDSNIVIDLLNNDARIATNLDKVPVVYVPVIVEGELLHGALHSANPSKHLSKVRSFLINCKVLQVDRNTAEVYAEIKTILRKKGTPIPENDIWIAALAIQHDLHLYTQDKHFKGIADLQLFPH